MLFIHALDKVLSGEKVQTSRIWKDAYKIEYAWKYHKTPTGVQSLEKTQAIKCIFSDIENSHGHVTGQRKAYYVGQVLSVQPARGAKGVAKIRITELARRDVRDFSYEDIVREGFEGISEFLRTWVYMHDKELFRTIEDYSYHANLIGAITDNRPNELYAALVIHFELVKD